LGESTGERAGRFVAAVGAEEFEGADRRRQVRASVMLATVLSSSLVAHPFLKVRRSRMFAIVRSAALTSTVQGRLFASVARISQPPRSPKALARLVSPCFQTAAD
jgi:hypothetical protein